MAKTRDGAGHGTRMSSDKGAGLGVGSGPRARFFQPKISGYFDPKLNRPIANMATISPKRGFSVATVARVWLPVLTCAVAGKTAASQASFPLNSTKISHFSPLKEVSIWYVRFEYCFSMLN